jgi:protein TonB
MFASPQIEEKPTRARNTAKISESSDPVFAAPDPNGAKPSSIEPAKRVVYVEPVYPAAARAAKIEGSVDILATIGKDGVPRSLEPLNGDPRLAAAAIAAISNWRYRPAMLNGQSEESLITITVKFAL